MPPQNPEPTLTPTTIKNCPWYQPLCQVTPTSKYLAMAVFILMPFLGGYVGYTLAPEKVVEVPIVMSTQDMTTNTKLENSLNGALPAAEQAVEDITSEYEGMIELFFNTNPFDTSELMIKTSAPGQISKPINLTGWTLESKQVGISYALKALTRTADKYTTATATDSVDIVFNPLGGEYVTVEVGAGAKDDFVYPAEGGNSYRFFSPVPLWGMAHDTITLRDGEGKIVSVYQY